MADASTRPKPRPRPRPVPRVTKSANTLDVPTQQPGPSSSVPERTSSSPAVFEDNDEMFMRNRGRTAQTWNTLNFLNNGHVASDSDSDRELSPRHKNKKKRVDEVEQPKWQTDERLKRFLSKDLSDDEIELVSSNMKSRKAVPSSPSKRKRQRSRSRSITPPPDLPADQILNTKFTVRQALPLPNIRPLSPSFDPDESTDTIIFDPELASIAKSVSRARIVSQNTADAKDTIKLSVTWQAHPLDAHAEPYAWVFTIHRGDTFFDVFDAIAEDTSSPSDSIIMSYNSKRFFASVTPAALKMWVEAQLTACTKTTYEYLKVNPQTGQAGQAFVGTQPSTQPEERPASPEEASDAPTESEADSDDEDKYKLILRSAVTSNNIVLTVRNTTKCGAIVKAFLKKAGLLTQYPNAGSNAQAAAAKKGKKKGADPVPAKDPRLFLDGDKLDNNSEIGDAGLEDGDLLEVVGL
ncbi:hypothetical protein BDN72DRAFT_761196 [Pluteus cervinus]|uniref:Uncharacterized protein n=1 Tax=Pluteus cervinus TaxID=181527 RepID=A0ACD3B6D1_9AGAR|nr:hypothetical protein BDN72DRAFT_761196 [Pluteus cervinus]